MTLSLKQHAILTASSVSALHYDLRIEGSLPRDIGGCLFLVLNHTSLSDPFLVARAIGLQGHHARFVTHTAIYKQHKWLMDQLGALPIPSTFDGKGDWTQEKIRRAIGTVHDALGRGEKIAIYPSGQLKAGAEESLGGKSMAYDILSRYPDTPVVIVELKGLMYSLTSRYFTGGVQSPGTGHVKEILCRAPWRFAMERVPVQVKFHQPQVLPPFPSARALNEHLESIVNATPDFAPAWRGALRTAADLEKYRFARTAAAAATTPLDVAVTAAVLDYLAGMPELQGQGVNADAIGPDMNLISDLGLDSLAEVTLRAWAEDSYGVTIDPAVQIMTVRDLIVACQGALAEVESGDAVSIAPPGWHEPSRRKPAFQDGDNLAHAIIRQCRAQGLGAIFTFDANARDLVRKGRKKPLVTYRDLLMRAIILARVLQREFPTQKRIAFLLPASAGAATFALGAMIAGKVLVPLNWTNGPAALDASIELASVDTVFTSEEFLEKAAVPLSKLATSRIVLAEDIRTKAGLGDLVAAARLVRRSPEAILRAFGNTAQMDDVAVVLFTSGSESAPKGVPLTHRNIMSNVEGSLGVIEGQASDVLLAFLPPFHSFGLVQLMTMSLLAGVKVVFSPDPRKFKHLAGLVEKFGVTLVAGTPDFLSGIIDATRENGQRLASVRIWLAGAQKSPATLRSRIQALGSELLEGYGITETSPLATVNRPGEAIVGVGRPIKDTTVTVVDIETMSQPMATGMEGLVLISGPGVFGGYLGSTASPFVTLQGRQYYNSGDLGHLDADGNLTISGRLKRFLKPFGEMVNMTSIEDAIASAYPAGEDGPRVAIAGVDVEGKRSFIVLYTTESAISLEAVKKLIKAAGMTNLSFVDQIERVVEIPMLGSGKINHRALPDPKGILKARGEAAPPAAGARVLVLA